MVEEPSNKALIGDNVGKGGGNDRRIRHLNFQLDSILNKDNKVEQMRPFSSKVFPWSGLPLAEDPSNKVLIGNNVGKGRGNDRKTRQ